MSMIGSFLRVSEDELKAFLNDSSLLEDRFYNEEDEETPNIIDIDKAWDGIIYLLTGNGIQGADLSNSEGLQAIIFSGQLIDPDQDMGYGPAHYLTPEQVKKFSDMLTKKTKESLFLNYNPVDMNEKGIYPVIWDEEGEAFIYLFSYFENLRDFYAEAAKENQAIISILN